LRFLVASAALLAASAVPAAAATTVYAAGVFSQGGQVANAANGLGAADGAFARIGNSISVGPFSIVGQAGQVVYSFADALSGAGLQLTGLGGAPGVSSVFVSIGEIVGGVAVFSAETNFTGGAGVFSFDLSTQCSAISLTGCSLVRVRTAGGLGRGAFRLDGISGVGAAPEPSAWALMLLGFGAVAWRLQVEREKHPLTIP
jgi:hypothetical protein